MNKAIIFTSRECDSQHYTLLIGTEFFSYRLEEDSEIEELAEDFAKIISARRESLCVGIMNGYRLTEDNLHETEKIDTQLFEQRLSSRLTQLSQGRAVVMSAARMN